jgi:peroxiredoxin
VQWHNGEGGIHIMVKEVLEMLKRVSIVLFLGYAMSVVQAMPLQKGMELRYEGEVAEKYASSGYPSRSLSYKVTLLVEVLECDQQKGAEIAQLTCMEGKAEIEGKERLVRRSNVLFGKTNPDGRTTHLSRLPLSLLPLNFVFFAPDRLKEGDEWNIEDDKILSVDFLPLPPKCQFTYKVEGKGDVEGVQCWLLSRRLSKPITLTEGKSELAFVETDWFWADAKTGLVRKLKSECGLELRKSSASGVEAITKTTVTTITLKQVSVLAPDDQKRLQQELAKVRTAMDAIENVLASTSALSEEQLKRAEQKLTEAVVGLRASPYANFYIPYLAVWLNAIHAQQKELEPAKLAGKLAPDFELPRVDGTGKLKLSDLKGKVVLLNFFAHWCPPCNAEAPRLEKEFWQAYKDKGVVVVGVSVWATEEPFKATREFVKRHGITYIVLVDPQKSAVANSYGVEGVPTNVVIDRDGKIRYIQAGYDPNRIKQAIEEALK